MEAGKQWQPRERRGKDEGNFWKWLLTHFLVYPAFEKRNNALPTLRPYGSSSCCITTPTSLSHQQHLNSSLVHLQSLSLHALSPLLLCVGRFFFHPFNKLFSPFLHLFFFFFHVCCSSFLHSIVEMRDPLVNNFPTRSSWVPSPFIQGLWTSPALVCFKWTSCLGLKLMAGNL